MIKAKIISLLVAGAVGVGGTIAIARVAWNGNSSLESSSENVSEYVKHTNKSMNKAQNIIEADNHKIKILEAQNEHLNNEDDKEQKTIINLLDKNSNLQNVIARLEGATKYKDMTRKEKINIINTLLTDWGYSNSTIIIVDGIFDVSEHWSLATIPQKSKAMANNNSNNSNTNILKVSKTNN